MNIKSALLALFFLSIPLCASIADSDVDLYGAKIPEDAAFVRFINLGFHQQTAQLNGKKYPKVKEYSVSPYYIVKEGKYNLSSFTKVQVADVDIYVEPQKFYSIEPYTEKILIDKRVEDRSKAVIAFYNFSSKKRVSLKANNGKINVFEDVARMHMEAREINGAKIDLSVYQGDNKLAEIVDVILERNNHHSVIFDGTDIRFFQATTDIKQ